MVFYNRILDEKDMIALKLSESYLDFLIQMWYNESDYGCGGDPHKNEKANDKEDRYETIYRSGVLSRALG